MPTVEIIHHKTRVGVEGFKRNFYILQEHLSGGEIFWNADGKNPRPGVIMSWIQLADTNPRIAGVLPDWQLVIDGVEQETKFYPEVENLSGKVVELRHNDYRFIFTF